MALLIVSPPIPASPAVPPPGFVQDIKLVEGKTTVALLRWTGEGGPMGTGQILGIDVAPTIRRAGNGTLMLREAYKQIDRYYRARGHKPRRVWLVLEQKTHVVPRAFFTKHGFHHTSTIDHLYKKQDAMIYSRSFD